VTARDPGRPVSRATVGVSFTVALAGLLAACGGPAPSLGSVAPATAPPATDAASNEAASQAPTGSSSAIVVDDALLALLPAQVGGVALTPDRETAAGLSADASLRVAVSDLAVATAFGPLASDGSADYAVITIVRLHPGAFSDAFFRDWRDSFDAAVCEQAGGVSGHAETEIAGHPTWIGTCAGGTHTYHATLEDDGVIVSLQGAGPDRFGEQVIAGLTE
jgi:hypothetical protein